MRTFVVGFSSTVTNHLSISLDCCEVDVVVSSSTRVLDEAGPGVTLVVLGPAIELDDTFFVQLDERRESGPALVVVAVGADDTARRANMLDRGVDICLPAGASVEEIAAAVRAIQRSSVRGSRSEVVVDDLRIRPAFRTIEVAAVDVELRPLDFDILLYLAERAGQVITRTELLDALWDGDYDGLSNLVDVHIASIRAAIDRPFGRRSIETVRGVGYRLRSSAAGDLTSTV